MSPSFRIPRKRPVPLSGTAGALRGFTHGKGSGITKQELELGQYFADFVEAPHAIPVAGARGGLWFMLKYIEQLHGLGEVIVPALTASIVPNVVCAAGFKVRFVDVDPKTFTAGADALLDAVGPQTRAIVVTHLEGFPVRTDRVMDALKGTNVWVLEDAAHAPGAAIGKRAIGSIGHAAIFSLGKGKHLNALDGGLVSTLDSGFYEYLLKVLGSLEGPSRTTVAKKIAVVTAMGLLTKRVFFDVTLWPGLQLYASRGKDPLYENFEDVLEPPGPEGPSAANRRLGPVQAQLALSALQNFPKQLFRRRSLHEQLCESASSDVVIQQAREGTEPAPLEFVIKCSDRNEARHSLRKLGIDSQPTWMVCPQQLPAFREEAGNQYPIAKELAQQLLYLPFYPGLHAGDISRMAELLSNPSQVAGL